MTLIKWGKLFLFILISLFWVSGSALAGQDFGPKPEALKALVWTMLIIFGSVVILCIGLAIIVGTLAYLSERINPEGRLANKEKKEAQRLLKKGKISEETYKELCKSLDLRVAEEKRIKNQQAK